MSGLRIHGPILILLLLLAACAAPIGPGDPGLRAYLAVSHHLTDAEKAALLEGRPFLGMTLQEANYALRPAGARREGLGAGESAQDFWATYEDADGALWAVRFAGGPPRRAVEFVPYVGQTLALPAPTP
jgi:hypothetical protein